MLTAAATARPMRFAGALLLFVPRVRIELAPRAFSVAGPTVYNSLPPKIRLSERLRSASSADLAVPQTRLQTIGDRALCVAAAKT